MSMEYCEHCGAHVDTDEDVEGEYETTPGVPYGRFRCSRCCEVRDGLADAAALEKGGVSV